MDQQHLTTTKTPLAFVVASILSLAASQAVLAEGETLTLEEVVVTAQKREELLQETPIAISAMSSRELETKRINSVMDLMNQAPSITIAPFAGTRVAPNLFIRGMGNLNAQSTNDMATSVYVDGVPVGRGIGMALDFADLERVELLRGPQGTLYGRNTTAGAINFITRKPDQEFGLRAQLTAGSWDLRAGRLSVNVPFGEKLAARLSYMRSENDGWIDNLSARPNQINFNEDRKKEAMKATIRFLPADNVTVDYSYDQSEMVFGNHFYQRVAGATAVPGRQESVASVRGMSPSETKVTGHMLAVEWDAGPMTLRSITGYRDLDNDVHMNFADLFLQDRTMKQDQFTQEVQLLGETAGGRVKYVTGLFYADEDTEEMLNSFGGFDVWAAEGEARSAAIFSQLTWTPAAFDDRLDLTLGLRYTEDSRRVKKTFIRPMPPGAGAVAGQVAIGDRDFNSFTPALTVAYAFTDTINGYAKFSTGYRAGGFNPQSTPVNVQQGFEEENVDAWEVGLKSELFNRRLRANLALFHNSYDDLQVDQARVPPIFVDTLNAGSATIDGAELEVNAVITRGLSANLYFTYLDADYGSYVDGGVELEAQRSMPNAPDWQVGGGLRYETALGSLGDLIFDVDFRAIDDFTAGPKLDTLTDGYGIWNARVQLANIAGPSDHGGFRVAVWGKNLSDKIYRLSTTNLGILCAQFGPPRSYGVDLIYDFY